MYNEPAATQIFSLREINSIIRAAGIYSANRKVFDSEQLLLDKNLIEKHSNDWLIIILAWL